MTPERVYTLSDASGYHSSGLYLPFNSGENTITIKSLRSGIKINFIEVAPLDDVPSYEDYLKKYDKAEQNNKNADTIGTKIAMSINHEKSGKIPTNTAHINAQPVIANERNPDLV